MTAVCSMSDWIYEGDGDSGIARTGAGAAVFGDRIYLVGGHSGKGPEKMVECFVPGPGLDDRGEWTPMAPMLARRAYVQVVTFDGKIFAIGGNADGRILNSVDVYTPESNSWTHWFTMPPMLMKRTLHAAAMVESKDAAGVVESKLLVVGGFDGTRDLSSFECYEPGNNSWTKLDNMSIGRSYLAAVAAHKHLYAIGGQDRRQEEGPVVHSSVEAFDLYSERWQPAKPLKIGRVGHSAAVLKMKNGDELIYVCGGSDGQKLTNTVEVLTKFGGFWEEAPPMTIPRHSHAVAVLNNKMYVIGGTDGKDTLANFECFDPEVGVSGAWGLVLGMGALPAEAREVSKELAESG